MTPPFLFWQWFCLLPRPAECAGAFWKAPKWAIQVVFIIGFCCECWLLVLCQLILKYEKAVFLHWQCKNIFLCLLWGSDFTETIVWKTTHSSIEVGLLMRSPPSDAVRFQSSVKRLFCVLTFFWLSELKLHYMIAILTLSCHCLHCLIIRIRLAPFLIASFCRSIGHRALWRKQLEPALFRDLVKSRNKS